MSRIVENTVRKLLEQHLVRISEENKRQSSETGRNTENEEAPATQHFARTNGKRRLKPSSQDTTITLKENGQRLFIRAAKSQYDSNVWIYHTWFGKVKMRTVYIEHHWADDFTFDRISRTDILVQPSPWLLKRGAMIKYEQQKCFSPLSNSPVTNAFTFQTFGIVPPDSPIFLACRRGNVAEMCRLFQSREASPHDRDALGSSLIDVALSKACDLIWTKPNTKRWEPDPGTVVENFPTKPSRDIFKIIELCINCGLDPAASACPIVNWLLKLDYGCGPSWPVWDEYIDRLARLVIKGSRTDPFEGLDLT